MQKLFVATSFVINVSMHTCTYMHTCCGCIWQFSEDEWLLLATDDHIHEQSLIAVCPRSPPLISAAAAATVTAATAAATENRDIIDHKEGGGIDDDDDDNDDGQMTTDNR